MEYSADETEIALNSNLLFKRTLCLDQAVGTSSKSTRRRTPFAKEVIERIAAVYALEERIRGFDADQRPGDWRLHDQIIDPAPDPPMRSIRSNR
jgi:hypothetical protein